MIFIFYALDTHDMYSIRTRYRRHVFYAHQIYTTFILYALDIYGTYYTRHIRRVFYTH